MIGILLEFGSEIVEVRIDDGVVYFRTSQFRMFATIDSMRLNKVGVVKEFPELENNEDWEKIARERFKMKVKEMKTEMEQAQYVIDDLKKFGYKPLYIQRKGFRPEKIS